MKKFKKLQTFIYLVIGQFLVAPVVFGAGSIKTTDLDKQDAALMGATNLGGNTDLATIISTLISVILGFLGIIFLVLTISAGFKWMTSQGNEEEIKKNVIPLALEHVGEFTMSAWSHIYRRKFIEENAKFVKNLDI